MTESSPVEIVQMEPWMIPGMAQLQALEYGVEPAIAERAAAHRFASTYPMKRGAIVLVGLSGRRVVAQQTYSPWPYALNGRTYASLQSGATLVHPEFRGRKLFQKMLAEGNRLGAALGHDFFIGFPVPASYPGFIKDGWLDLGRLRWWIRPVAPIALIRQRRQGRLSTPQLSLGEPLSRRHLSGFDADARRFKLQLDDDFLEWLYPESNDALRYFEYRKRSRRVGMVVKLSQAHGYLELLVGKIRAANAGPATMARALDRLCRAARREGVAAVSTAYLSPTPTVRAALILSGFVPYRTSAPLIVRPLRALPEATRPVLWRNISLEDIDAW